MRFFVLFDAKTVPLIQSLWNRSLEFTAWCYSFLMSFLKQNGTVNSKNIWNHLRMLQSRKYRVPQATFHFDDFQASIYAMQERLFGGLRAFSSQRQERKSSKWKVVSEKNFSKCPNQYDFFDFWNFIFDYNRLELTSPSFGFTAWFWKSLGRFRV